MCGPTRKICCWLIGLLLTCHCLNANPAMLDNLQLFSTLHWYQLENYRLQLLYRIQMTEMQQHYADLEERFNEVEAELESTQKALASARATIQMQTSVIKSYVREAT